MKVSWNGLKPFTKRISFVGIAAKKLGGAMPPSQASYLKTCVLFAEIGPGVVSVASGNSNNLLHLNFCLDMYVTETGVHMECSWKFITKMTDKKEIEFRECVHCGQKEMWCQGYWLPLPPFKSCRVETAIVQYANQ